MVSRRAGSTTAKGRPGKGWQQSKPRYISVLKKCPFWSDVVCSLSVSNCHPYWSASWSLPWGPGQCMMDSGRETPNLGNGKIISPEPWGYGERNFLVSFGSQLGDILNWFLQCLDGTQGLGHPGPWACWARSTVQLHHSSLPLLGEFHFAPKPGILNPASASQALGSWECSRLP